MQAVKHSLKYILVFLITVMLLTGILVLSAKIPKSAIEDNIHESAVYLCEGELFGMKINGVNSSKIDRYADSILLGIAYGYDSEHPIRSVMQSLYYHLDTQNENENLLDAVENDYEPNQQYMRYWHGSIAVVRPLLLFFNIRQIYILNGIIMTSLVICLLTILIKNKAYAPAIGVAAGLIATASWFVPFSLEYTWSYMIMLIMSIIGVQLAFRGRKDYAGIFFMIGGVVTSYMDFLTTETLTLLIPLILILWISMRKEENVTRFYFVKKSVKAAGIWICGYVGMWLMKWTMAALVLKENVWPYISEHIGERLGGDIGISPWQYITGAVFRNIKCLFPLEYGVIGILVAIVLLLTVAYFGYVYRKKNIRKNRVLIYAAAGIVPYIRYIILHNHSYLHCFFTYRAQMATILVIVLILEEMAELKYFRK